MPRLTPQRAEARRRHILDAAIECFARHGFHKTTMADICEAAGLSPGAVYCWFASKEEIIEAVAEERHGRERELFQVALDAGDPAMMVHRFLEAYFDWLADPEEMQRRRVGVQVWAEALLNDQLRKTVEKGVGQRAMALDFVSAAQGAGVFPPEVDADALTRIMLALIQGFILQQAWEPDVDIDAYRRAVTLLVDTIASSARQTRQRGTRRR